MVRAGLRRAGPTVGLGTGLHAVTPSGRAHGAEVSGGASPAASGNGSLRDMATTDDVEQGLRQAIAAAEQAKAPELDTLTTLLVQRLLTTRRLAEATECMTRAAERAVRLPGSLARQLAQAQHRAGDLAAAEATVRDVLKREGQ